MNKIDIDAQKFVTGDTFIHDMSCGSDTERLILQSAIDVFNSSRKNFRDKNLIKHASVLAKFGPEYHRLKSMREQWEISQQRYNSIVINYCSKQRERERLAAILNPSVKNLIQIVEVERELRIQEQHYNHARQQLQGFKEEDKFKQVQTKLDSVLVYDFNTHKVVKFLTDAKHKTSSTLKHLSTDQSTCEAFHRLNVFKANKNHFIYELRQFAIKITQNHPQSRIEVINFLVFKALATTIKSSKIMKNMVDGYNTHSKHQFHIKIANEFIEKAYTHTGALVAIDKYFKEMHPNLPIPSVNIQIARQIDKPLESPQIVPQVTTVIPKEEEQQTVVTKKEEPIVQATIVSDSNHEPKQYSENVISQEKPSENSTSEDLIEVLNFGAQDEEDEYFPVSDNLFDQENPFGMEAENHTVNGEDESQSLDFSIGSSQALTNSIAIEKVKQEEVKQVFEEKKIEIVTKEDVSNLEKSADEPSDKHQPIQSLNFIERCFNKGREMMRACTNWFMRIFFNFGGLSILFRK